MNNSLKNKWKWISEIVITNRNTGRLAKSIPCDGTLTRSSNPTLYSSNEFPIQLNWLILFKKLDFQLLCIDGRGEAIALDDEPDVVDGRWIAVGTGDESRTGAGRGDGQWGQTRHSTAQFQHGFLVKQVAIIQTIVSQHLLARPHTFNHFPISFTIFGINSIWRVLQNLQHLTHDVNSLKGRLTHITSVVESGQFVNRKRIDKEPLTIKSFIITFIKLENLNEREMIWWFSNLDTYLKASNPFKRTKWRENWPKTRYLM